MSNVTRNGILFSFYNIHESEVYLFFGLVKNGEVVLLDSLEHEENEYELVDGYMNKFPDFQEACDAHWTKYIESSFEDTKKEMKIICEKMIFDGFIYSDKVGELGYCEHGRICKEYGNQENELKVIFLESEL